jgi:hypothetical protein
MRIRPGLVWTAFAAAVFIGAFVLPPVRIPASIDWIVAAIPITLFAIALVLATLGIGRMVIRAWIRARLLRIGRPTVARVLKIKRWGVAQPTLDDIVIVRLTLELLSEMPRLIDLQETIDVDWVPEIGDEITILVDPRRPWRFRLSPNFYQPPNRQDREVPVQRD